MKNMKRIHRVTIKRLYDESPDLSWLGEYGSRAESEFSIDRAHDLDCPQQAFNRPNDTIEQVERVLEYIFNRRNELTNASEDVPLFDWYDSGADFISELQDEIQEDANACTCGGQFVERNSYQYFNPCHENYKGLDRAEIIKYCLQDFARAESGNRGDWCMIGIRAEGKYSLTNDPGWHLIQTLTSGGLWGIESDSGNDYLESIEQEELAELRAQLTALGFSKRAISTAFKSIEESGDAR